MSKPVIKKLLLRTYPQNKKNLVNDWEIIIAYQGESDWSEGLTKNCGLFQKTTWGFGVVAAVQPQENLANFTLI